MKRQFLFGSVFATAMAVGLGAQGTGTTGQATGQTPDRGQGQTMTITGCLKKADELSRTGAATGAAATAAQTGATAQRSAAMDRDEFVLLRPAGMTAFNVRTGATQTGQTAQTQAQTGQTAGTTGMTGAAAMGYRLVGSDNLEQHVNKQVEVRGTVEDRDRTSATAQTGRTTGQTGQTGQAARQSQTSQPKVDDLPELRVTSVRQVADSCSADNR